MIRRTSRPADNYTTIANAALRDARLSRGARGLLAELLSHAVGWTTTIRGLAEAGPEGKALISKYVAELKQFGYLALAQDRAESGAFGSSIWDVTDEPQPTVVTTPYPVSRDTVPPDPVKRSLKKNNPKKNNEIKKRSAQPTSIPDDWVPKIDARPVAESLGLDHDFQLVEFRRWYRASGVVKADWDAQFEIWLRNPKTARTAKARAQKPAGAVALDFTPPPRRECQHLRVADSGYCESCGERVPDWQASAVRGLAEGGAF